MRTAELFGNRRTAGIVLAVLLIFTFVPWLGLTLFNTKGEPREALVAVSMLQTGNFILPESYGADIPYKPPFLAWLIAAFSWIGGGTVTEFSSRLPSALATIGLVVGGFAYYSRQNVRRAIAMGIVTVTSVEVFRAASACRVDMVLTACMVCGIYAFARHDERRGSPGVSWTGIALFTCATLTKGPVGAALPCLALWIYYLLRGRDAWRSSWTLAVSGAASMIIPAIWYYAAWTQGGERFLNLAMEENFGRLTGTMSYSSHENPVWYNFMTLAAGMAPYTLLCLMALFAARWRKIRSIFSEPLKKVRGLDGPTLLALTVTMVVFVFYCIPKSKRSVYLLPIYPFCAYFVTLLAEWLISRRKGSIIKSFAAVISLAGLLVGWTAWGLHMVDAGELTAGMKGVVPDLATGLYAAHFGIIDWALLLACIGTSCVTLWMMRGDIRRLWWTTLGNTLAIYWTISAIILPPILNAKSDMAIVEALMKTERIAGGVYSFNSVDMLRYYTTAFYIGDRVRLFAPEEGTSQSTTTTTPLPSEGLLIVSEPDMNEWLGKYGRDYAADTLWHGTRKSGDVRAIPMLVGFRKMDIHLREGE